MHTKVKVNIRLPLKKEREMCKPRGEWCLVKFKYEHMGVFCFWCGKQGPVDQIKIVSNCSILRLMAVLIVHRGQRLEPIGRRWLREEGLVQADIDPLMVQNVTKRESGSSLYSLVK